MSGERTTRELVDAMLENGDTVTGWHDAILENVKAQICDHYCKYPGEYKHRDDGDIDYEQMLTDVCESCPLNVL